MLKRLELFREGANKSFQVITWFGGQTPFNRPEDLLEIQDMNFDGYRDLGIQYSRGGSAGQRYYTFWLYDPRKRGFFLIEELKSLCDPVRDVTKHRLTSTCKEGPDYYVTETYTFKNGRLVAAELKETDLSGRELRGTRAGGDGGDE